MSIIPCRLYLSMIMLIYGLFPSNSNENQDHTKTINIVISLIQVSTKYYVWFMLNFGQTCRVQCLLTLDLQMNTIITKCRFKSERHLHILRSIILAICVFRQTFVIVKFWKPWRGLDIKTFVKILLFLIFNSFDQIPFYLLWGYNILSFSLYFYIQCYNFLFNGIGCL